MGVSNVPVYECGQEAEINNDTQLRKKDFRDILDFTPSRVCEIINRLHKNSETFSLSKQIQILVRICKRAGLLEIWEESEREAKGKIVCCMDDRVPKSKNTVNMAGSGILLISEKISCGMNAQDIVEMMGRVFESNGVGTISSHQDCWAAKLFCARMQEHFWVDDIKKLEQKLEAIFPWLDEYEKEESYCYQREEDIIVAALLKYIALKLSLKYTHINLENQIGEVPKHAARTVILDLSEYNLTGFFEKHGINPWFFLDVSMFIEHPEHIDSMVEQAIISKLIALRNSIISEEKNMFTIITYQRGQEALCKMIQSAIDEKIEQNHSELIWKYTIVPVKV